MTRWSPRRRREKSTSRMVKWTATTATKKCWNTRRPLTVRKLSMGIFTAIHMALAALLVHKGRSVLTSLGIVIGTGAVIAMVSAAGGARLMLDERLDNVGKNLILIRAGSRTQNGALADVKPLTNEDAAVVRKQLGRVLLGVAEVQPTVRLAATRTHNCITMVVGTSPDMRKVRTWVVEKGR